MFFNGSSGVSTISTRPTRMETGTRVRLRTFNGLPAAPPGIAPDENYWLLIGKLGTVRQDATEPSLHRLDSGHRFCIEFDDDVSSLGLTCHNPVKNSLWILESDLELIGEST